MRVKNSIINSSLSIISLVILAVLGFVQTKYFISTLGVEYNGLNGVFTNILSILAITELGLGGAITYNLYKPIAEKKFDEISSIMKFYQKCYRIIGIVIFTLSLLISFFIQIFLKDTSLDLGYIRFVFLLFAINTSFSYFFSYNRNLIYAYQKNYIIVIVDFIFKALKILIQILSLIIYKNYVLFLIINIIFTLGANIFIHLYTKHNFKNIDVKSAKNDNKLNKKVFVSVKSLAIAQLLSASINFTDNIIISSFVSIVTAGLYANYNLLFSQIQKIIVSIYNNIGAAIGNLIAEDKNDHSSVILINLEYISFFIASFCACCFFILTQPFIEIWIGPQYLLSIIILNVLVFNFYMLVNQQPINYFLSGNGLFKKMIFPLALQSIINLVLSIILAIKIGLLGVFIGTLVSSLICWIITSKIIYNKYKLHVIKYYIRQIIFIILTIFEIAIIFVISKLYTPSNPIIKLIYLLFWCLLIPNLFSILIIIKDNKISYTKELLIKIKNKFKKKGRK